MELRISGIERFYAKVRDRKSLLQDEMIVLLLDKILTPSWRPEGVSTLRFVPQTFDPGTKKILLMQLFGLGDVVLSLPSLSAIQEQYPHAEVSYLTSESGFDLLKNLFPGVKVLLFPRFRFRSEITKGRPLGSLLQEIKDVVNEIKEEGFDLLINLGVQPENAYLTHLIGAERIFGMTIDKTGHPFVSGNVWSAYFHFIQNNSTMQGFRKLNLVELDLKISGVSPSSRRIEIPLDTNSLDWAHREIRVLGIGENDLIVGMIPGTGIPANAWNEGHFSDLINLVMEGGLGAKVLLFGGEREKDKVKRILGSSRDGVYNLCGKTRIHQLPAIFSLCSCVVAGDTGPMHVAASSGTKVIEIAGQGKVGPYGTANHVIINYIGECESPVDEISPSVVFETIKYVLGKRRDLPSLPNIKYLTSGDRDLTRLFSHFPLRKEVSDQNRVARDILGLLSLNLWIEENRQLGFEEDLITQDELWDELRRHYRTCDLKRGLEEAKDIIEEHLHHLRKCSNEGEGGREELKFLDFINVITPRGHTRGGIERYKELVSRKIDACLSMKDFLKHYGV